MARARAPANGRHPAAPTGATRAHRAPPRARPSSRRAATTREHWQSSRAARAASQWGFPAEQPWSSTASPRGQSSRRFLPREVDTQRPTRRRADRRQHRWSSRGSGGIERAHPGPSFLSQEMKLDAARTSGGRERRDRLRARRTLSRWRRRCSGMAEPPRPSRRSRAPRQGRPLRANSRRAIAASSASGAQRGPRARRRAAVRLDARAHERADGRALSSRRRRIDMWRRDRVLSSLRSRATPRRASARGRGREEQARTQRGRRSRGPRSARTAVSPSSPPWYTTGRSGSPTS